MFIKKINGERKCKLQTWKNTSIAPPDVSDSVPSPGPRKEEMTTGLPGGASCAHGSPVGPGKEATCNLGFQKDLSP